MNRRSFLVGLSLAPIAATSAVAATDTPNEYLRAVLGTADLPTPSYPIDARGAQQGVGEEIRRALAAYDRQLPARVHDQSLPARHA